MGSTPTGWIRYALMSALVEHHNTIASRLSLIGRDRVFEQLQEALDQQRLVTVFGPPGVGKSALLEQLLHTDDSLLLVDLTEAHTLRDVFFKLAATLELTLDQGESQAFLDTNLSKIGRALAARGHVLVLDNTEHLNELLKESLEKLIETTPLCYVLGSRHILGLEQEHVIKLAPLETQAQAGELSPAAMLFLERSPVKRYSPASLRAIEQLVSLLDGLPLAIELLASRAKLLTPEQLLARQQHENKRLTSLDKLHQAISISWELLSPADRIALRALAFERSGLSVADAEQLLAEQQLGLGEPLTHIEHLEQCALIQLHEDEEGFRIKLLLSIRDFVQAQTWDDPQLIKRLEQRYIELIAKQTYDLYLESAGAIWSDAARALVKARSNIEHALALLEPTQEEHLKAQVMLRLGLSTATLRQNDFELLFELVSHHDEAFTRPELELSLRVESMLVSMDAASAQMSPAEAMEKFKVYKEQAAAWPEHQQLQYFIKLAHLAGPQDQDEIGITGLIERAKALKMTQQQVDGMLASANYHVRRDELSRAAAIAQEAAEIALQHHMLYFHARALTYLSFCYSNLGQFELSYPLMFKAAEHFVQINHVVASVHTLYQAAEICLEENRLTEAKQALQILGPLSRRHGLVWATGMTHYMSGLILMEEAQYTQAQIELERAAIDLEQSHRQFFCVAAHLAREQCALLHEDEAMARSAHQALLHHSNSVSSTFAVIQIKGSMLHWALQDQRRDDAQGLIEEINTIGHDEALMYLQHLAMFYRSKVALYDYEQAFAKKKARKMKEALAQLLEALSPLLTPDSTQTNRAAPVDKLFSLRMGMRLLKRDLPEQLSRRLEIMLQDPQRQALLIDLKTQSFRPPGELDWVEMANRNTPFKLLSALVEQRIERPGEALTPEQLCEAVWPDEIVTAEAASNRLYVTIATIRRCEGMKELILSDQGGYLLDPQVPLYEA